MKAIIVKQWEELCAIEESSELYRIFFRVFQVISGIAVLLQLAFLFPMIMNLAYHPAYGFEFNPLYLVLPLVLTLAQILAVQYASKLIREVKFRGTAIGLVISLLCVPSLYLPLGAFGLYCFLNPGYQRKYLSAAPKPFVDFLRMLGIDFITREKVGETV